MIEGMRNRNRALERDVVAVRLNPDSEWKVRNAFIFGVGGLGHVQIWVLILALSFNI